MKLLVIGGGPAGYVAAIRAAQLGATVDLIEADQVGGVCLNRGCIPTKALLHTAEVYQEALTGANCGVDATVGLDFAQAQRRKADVVNRLTAGVASLLKASAVNVIKGQARFLDAHSVELSQADAPDTVVTADRFIVATGSVPVRPPIPGLDLPVCLDSTEALELAEVPRSMVIVGGGVIGVEMATIYATLGCEVTIVELLDQILPMMDDELTAIVRAKLEADGIRIHTSSRVLAVEPGQPATVRVEIDGQPTGLPADKVLVSVGRRPNTDGLGLEAAGIIHQRGRILTDDHQRTNVAGIFAAGDCTSQVMLAHVASAQGEVAAENAAGLETTYDGRTNPSCVYTQPEFAGVGLTEAQATERGLSYKIGRFPLSANGKTLIAESDGLVKVIAGAKYGEILGVHMVGPRATDLIAEAALAIRLEATVEELISTIHAHPTVSEALHEAAMAVDHRAIHLPG